MAELRLTSHRDFVTELPHFLVVHDVDRFVFPYPIVTADLSPAETLIFLLEENGMSVHDLGRLLGDRAAGQKILTGKRDLSKDQIQLLAEHFKVSPGLFF